MMHFKFHSIIIAVDGRKREKVTLGPKFIGSKQWDRPPDVMSLKYLESGRVLMR